MADPAASTVVNCRVRDIRPEYQDLEAWVANPNNVYIGRRGVVFVRGVRFPAHDSTWANPFKVGRDGSRDEVIERYEAYIRQRLASEEGLRRELATLAGKALGCWCYPERCHGDVLVRILREAPGPAARLDDADLAEVLGFGGP